MPDDFITARWPMLRRHSITSTRSGTKPAWRSATSGCSATMSPGLRSEGIIERTRGGDMETRNARLLFPGLRSFYDRLEPLSWLLVRCACGLILAVHGWGK